MAKKKEEIKYPVSIGSYVPPNFAQGSDLDGFGGTIDSTARSRGSLRRANLVKNLYPFITELPDPFHYDGNHADIKDVLVLAERVYFGFPIYRNVIETLTELANQEIYLEGGNKAARTFINKWLDKIGIWSLKDMWFRTCALYANIYPYRCDAPMNSESLKKLSTVFGNKMISEAAVKLPVKYIFLNPINMTREVGLTENGDFIKILTRREIEKINRPKTDEEREFRDSFTAKQLEEIKKSNGTYSWKIDREKLYYTGHKTLNHWPFSVPFVFGLFKDINFKFLLKKMDEELAKSVDLMILLLTTGASPNDGGINYDNIKALQNLFKNPKLQRVLISDWTTRGQWLIPDVSAIMGKAKYEQVDLDLKRGLAAIFFEEGEKFASLSIKAKVFLEKLNELRNLFINDFLQPEIKRVCQSMGFKVFPTAKFVNFDLDDNVTLRKIYLRMAELGLLTAFDIKDAINKGILPNEEDMRINQEKFRDWKSENLFEPQLNKKDPTEPGRPAGTNTPKSKTTTKPIGTKASISILNLRDSALAFDKVEQEVTKLLNKQIKGKKDKDFEKMTFNVSQSIILNGKQESIAEFVKSPEKANAEKLEKIRELEEQYEISEREATLIFLSNKE